MNPSDTMAEPLHFAQPWHEAADNAKHAVHHLCLTIRWRLLPLLA
jgi:hypothetical protein